MKVHPDRAGADSTATFQALNAANQRVLIELHEKQKSEEPIDDDDGLDRFARDNF